MEEKREAKSITQVATAFCCVLIEGQITFSLSLSFPPLKIFVVSTIISTV